jgi:hypothetical protein
VLQGGGESDIHEHPGDEFVLVRSGEVEVRFEDTGLRTTLRSGEFMHYYAEQRHSAFNVGDRPAELFVVRFYQVATTGTRQAIWTSLQQALRANDPRDAFVPAEALSWFLQMIPTYATRLVGAIQDVLGLDRFLERWLEVLGKEDLSTASIVPPIANQLRIVDLSKRYGIPEYVLYSFAQPAVGNVIAVRAEDFVRVPQEVLPDGVEYQLPRRNLACSDISIALVTIAPTPSSTLDKPKHHGTTEARHPGFEAILVRRGRVDVYFGAEVAPACTLTADTTQLCHFDSSVAHRIENPSATEEAELLVIRFYRDGIQ